MQTLRTFALTLVVAVVTASAVVLAHDGETPPPAPPPDSPVAKCVNACGEDMLACVQPCVKQGEEAETDQRCVEGCRKRMESCMVKCR